MFPFHLVVLLLLTHPLARYPSFLLASSACFCLPLIFTSLVRGGDGAATATATPAAYKNARSEVVLSATTDGDPETAPLSQSLTRRKVSCVAFLHRSRSLLFGSPAAGVGTLRRGRSFSSKDAMIALSLLLTLACVQRCEMFIDPMFSTPLS